MSYNVLADFYHSMRKVKKLCSEFNYRFPQLKKEIREAECDILLLQEVDHWESHYKPFLTGIGYALRRVQKRHHRDSIVIGFRATMFDILDEAVVDFDDLALAGQSLHVKHNKALVVVLKHKQSSDIVVCSSTQLYFNPNMDYLKFAQTFYLYKRISKIVLKTAKSRSLDWRKICIILGGDFNSLPGQSAI